MSHAPGVPRLRASTSDDVHAITPQPGAPMTDKVHLSAEQQAVLLGAIAKVVCTVVNNAFRDDRGDDIDRRFAEECTRLSEELAARLATVRWVRPTSDDPWGCG